MRTRACGGAEAPGALQQRQIWEPQTEYPTLNARFSKRDDLTSVHIDNLCAILVPPGIPLSASLTHGLTSGRAPRCALTAIVTPLENAHSRVPCFSVGSQGGSKHASTPTHAPIHPTNGPGPKTYRQLVKSHVTVTHSWHGSLATVRSKAYHFRHS